MTSADLDLGQDLNLGGLVDGVVDLVDDLLGGDLGDVVKDLDPDRLIKDLGKTIERVLGGGDADLLQSLLDNKVVDPALLQNVLDGGDIDLGALDDLLSNADLDNLEEVLDQVFDNGLLGLDDTTLDLDALAALTGVDLQAVTTYVTSMLAAIVKSAGDAADIAALLDAVSAGDDRYDGTGGPDKFAGGAGDDVIFGKAGADTLSGDEGDDRVHGDKGNDVLSGGDGADKLWGGAGADTLNSVHPVPDRKDRCRRPRRQI